MSVHGHALVGWGLAAVACLASVGLLVGIPLAADSPTALVLYEHPIMPFVYAGNVIVIAVVGAVVIDRHPRNAVGWVLMALGLSMAIGQALTVYADLALYGDTGLPGGAAAAVAGWHLGGVINLALILIMFLFPTGRAISRAWHRVVVGSVTALALWTVAGVLRPGRVGEFAQLNNPLAVGGVFGGVVDVAADVLFVAIPASAALAVWSLVSRYRRAIGVERVQLRWFAYAGSLLGVGGAVSFAGAIAGSPAVADGAFIVVMIGTLLFPAAIGVAILRYRLYEIDRLVNRTVVYGGVMTVLAGIYVTGVFGLGELVRIFGGAAVGADGESSLGELFVAASTLAAVAAFRPVRRRVQSVVDRRFDRTRYDATATLASFGARIRDQVNPDALADDLRELAATTMRSPRTGVWIARGTHVAASAGLRHGGSYAETRAAYEAALETSAADAVRRARIRLGIGRTWQAQMDPQGGEALLAAERDLDATPERWTPSGWGLWIDIRLERLFVAYQTYDADLWERLVDDTRAAVEQHGSLSQRSRYWWIRASIDLRTRRYVPRSETLGFATEALRLAREAGDPIAIAEAQFAVGFCHLWDGALEPAERELDSALERADAVGLPDTRARCIAYLTLAARARGDTEQVRLRTERLSREAEEQHNPVYIFSVRAHRAWLALQAGDVTRARLEGEAAVRASPMPRFVLLWMALWPLVAAHVAVREAEEAVARARELLEVDGVFALDARLAADLRATCDAWDGGEVDRAMTILEETIERGERILRRREATAWTSS